MAVVTLAIAGLYGSVAFERTISLDELVGGGEEQ